MYIKIDKISTYLIAAVNMNNVPELVYPVAVDYFFCTFKKFFICPYIIFLFKKIQKSASDIFLIS
jgi:hypothetical protein